MERPILFIQSLFIILVASHVVYACSCRRLTLEESLCPERNKTVLMGKVKRVTLLDSYGNATKDQNAPYGKYKMKLQKSFKNGTTPLNTTDRIFHMTFARAESLCGRKFEKGDSYVFVGYVLTAFGDFWSNTCQVIIPKMVAVRNTTIMDTLQDTSPIDTYIVFRLGNESKSNGRN